jgi:hypothetical protein
MVKAVGSYRASSERCWNECQRDGGEPMAFDRTSHAKNRPPTKGVFCSHELTLLTVPVLLSESPVLSVRSVV